MAHNDGRQTTINRYSRFAEDGGPDLRHIIVSSLGMFSFSKSTNTNTRLPKKRRAPPKTGIYRCRHQRPDGQPNSSTGAVTKARKCSAYCENLEVHLRDYRIYLNNCGSHPVNEPQVLSQLLAERAASSNSSISAENFQKFKAMHKNLHKESDVMSRIFPLLCGSAITEQQHDVGSTQIAPIAGEGLTAAQPDFFDGSKLEELNRKVHDDLFSVISPRASLHVCIVPNRTSTQRSRGRTVLCLYL